MNVECCICFEKQFINPCGAFNNCKVCVCNDCKMMTMYNDDDDDTDYFAIRCLFCKEFDFKASINYEIITIVDDDAFNPSYYILYMLRYNHNDRYKDFYINNNDYGYCFICEED